jgi:sugar/nucleoside kinase (ribokinase family)
VPAALLDGAALLHLTGYSLFAPGPREVALGLIAQARRLGVPFTVDPSSAAFLRQCAPGAFLDWTSGAAVCFPNRDEAAALGGVAGLARHYGVVALKLGKDGAVLATADAPPVTIPAMATTVRDTTGAGDAFCAGFLAAWLAGSAMAAAVRAGTAAAAEAVSILGGRPDDQLEVRARWLPPRRCVRWRCRCQGLPST